MAELILLRSSGSGVGSVGPVGPPGPSATVPNDYTIGALSYEWLETSMNYVDGGTGIRRGATYRLKISIPVTPPGAPVPLGGHIYVEVPDQSATPSVLMDGATLMDSSGTMQGSWAPESIDEIPYIAAAQPFSITLDVTLTSTTDIRVYVASYTSTVDNVLVQHGQPGATPSAVVTVAPPVGRKLSSGTNRTTLLVTSISASVAATVNVAGKLRRPVSVTVDLTGLPATLPDNWAYQLVGYVNGDLSTQPVLISGLYRVGGLAGAGPDGISTAHTFGPEEPTASTTIVIYAVAGVVSLHSVAQSDLTARGGTSAFLSNNIVPGITASTSVTIGTTTGVTDPTVFVQSLLDTSVGVNSAVFGVLPLGIDTARIALLAVDTAQLAALSATAAKLASGAVTTAKIAALNVDTAALAAAAVTTAKVASANITTALIAGANITTALIANAAITSALIGSAAVGTAAIQNAAITTALIANAAITNALIGTAAVSNAQIIDCAVSKLTAGTISVAVSLTAPTITITSGSLTINLDASNLFKVTDSGTHRQSVVSAQNYTNTDTSFGLSGSLGATVMTITDGSNFVNVTKNAVSFNSTQVLTIRQTGPGTPSFGSLANAQTWCQSLLTALQTHGIVS